MPDDDAERLRGDWVNAHMGKTSKQTAERLLTTPQPRPPADAPLLVLRGVRARCVAGGASNFWILKADAAEPLLTGEFPMTGMSPTAYFIQAPNFNNLPYAVPRANLTSNNHEIRGAVAAMEAQMREVYG